MTRRLENDNINYCVEGYNNWYMFNGTEKQFSQEMRVTCNTIDQICCKTINVTSPNGSNSTFYQEHSM